MSSSVPPDKGSIPDLALLFGDLGIQFAKFITSLKYPEASAGIELAGAFAKSVVEYQTRKRNEQLEEFIRELGEMLKKQGKILEKLTKVHGEDAEPLVPTFVWNADAAYRDDEEAKAKFYAAFAAGIMERGGSAGTLSRHAAFCDAMRRLRAHELYVLLLLARCQETASGPVIVELDGGARLEGGKEPRPKHETELVTFESLGQALCSLAGIGLVQQQAYGFGQMGAAPPVNAYHITHAGSALAWILNSNMTDIQPIKGNPPDNWDELLH